MENQNNRYKYCHTTNKHYNYSPRVAFWIRETVPESKKSNYPTSNKKGYRLKYVFCDYSWYHTFWLFGLRCLTPSWDVRGLCTSILKWQVKSCSFIPDHNYNETQRNAEYQKTKNAPADFIKGQRHSFFNAYFLVFAQILKQSESDLKRIAYRHHKALYHKDLFQ